MGLLVVIMLGISIDSPSTARVGVDLERLIVRQMFCSG